MSNNSQWIREVDTASFQQEVVEESLKVPVIVDFWAAWCEPCKQLAPLLEKLAVEYDGKFILAKVNIETAQEIATAFGVSSIPYVVALYQGQLVNQFQGMLPEADLRTWLDSVLPSRLQELLTSGMAVEKTDPKAAEVAYAEAAELEPTNDLIQVRLAVVLLAQKRDDEARAIIEKLAERGYLEPEAEAVQSELLLRAEAAEEGGVEQARAAVAANPDDYSYYLKLADALAVENKHREALDLCIDVITKNKLGVGLEAKETMLQIFDTLGAQSTLVGEYRRKLATLLY